MEPVGSMPRSQELSNNSYPEPNQPNYQSSSEALCDVSEHPCFYSVEVVSLTPNPQAGGPLLVGCPRLLIQYIRI